MPLRDHFHPPLDDTHPWESVHSMWITELVRHLNEHVLPPGYYALPTVSLGKGVEIDVAALKQSPTPEEPSPPSIWAPPRPALVTAVDFMDVDVFEIVIRSREHGPRLRAAIELVSPANKDRPSHRQAFTSKCATYLQQGLGLVIIDVVTERHANLHQELMQQLRVPTEPPQPLLYAVAYHVATEEPPPRLEVWPEPLALGAPLPTLPLWLADDLAVPLNLEISYQAIWPAVRLGQ
jgi:hypothetical protein